MKTVICYFSGTGNTQKIADRYAEVLGASGEVETFLIEEVLTEKKLPQELIEKIENCDLLGIGYPVYAFNAPPILLKFAKSLPHSKKIKRAFLFSSSGEPLTMNNISSIKLSGILRRRNFDITNEYHYCMPYNIIFRHSDAMAYKMWQVAQQLVALDAAEISAGVAHRLKRVRCGKFLAWVMRCEHWGGRLNGRLYRVSKECVHCNKCVNSCPTHNIKITKNGKIKFGGKCLMCMRCAHLCPANAIKIGLFNSWKVNGAYNFDNPDEEQQQEYNKMLTKAYEQYFEEAQKRIDQAK